MKAKILKYLIQNRYYISGEELSTMLNLSRQGLWKHMNELRQVGYDIAAVPHLGYKLVSCPDRLFSWEVQNKLSTKFMGRHYFYYDIVSSTMDIAWGLADKGLNEGTVVCAESQRRGRGRLKREWSSPKFKGLYFSVILRPDVSLQKVSCITLLCAVALVKAINKLTKLSIEIKWPNDILLERKKLAGILTEINAGQDKINFVVAGIGINVNNRQAEMPDNAISLRSRLGKSIDRVDILGAILKELELAYLNFVHTGPKQIINEWRRFSYIWGERIKISNHSKIIYGEALDLDSDGALMVRKDTGAVEKIIAGDITAL